MTRLALAGPMGAGKTTVGRILSRRHEVPFVDLDQEVGDVAAVFRAEGLEGFRRRERQALLRVVEGHGVLALGGGTVVDPRNVEALGGWTIVVLMASLATLRARVGDDPGRPLAAEMGRLLEERAALYASLGPTVETDGRDPERVADDLERWC